MRVLFVNERAGFTGGVEQYVLEAARGLTGRGHECALAFGLKARDAAAYLSAFSDFLCCPELTGEGRGADAFDAIVSRFQPDVVFVHKVTRVPDRVFDNRWRTVRMVHDHDLCCPRRHKYYAATGTVCDKPAGWRCFLDAAFLESREGTPRFVSIGGRMREMRRSWSFDALLVGSQFMADELAMNGCDDARVTLMPPVVPLAAGAPVPPPAVPHIAYVGQLIRGKGVDLLLEALARMRHPVGATIVGTGNAEGELREHSARLGLTGRVEFRGWVDHAAIGRVYDAATVVAVPSRWPEPFGLIGLESMLRSRPVVAFDVGGIRQWLRHDETGVLVPPQDTAAFAQALDRLTGNRALCERFGSTARSVAVRDFSHTAHLDSLERSLHGADAAVRLAVR